MSADAYGKLRRGPGPRDRTIMRDKIKKLTEDLLIRDGYAGFRFQDLAELLSVTRASIHYHFASKQSLCEEVILDGIADGTGKYEELLTQGERDFASRVRAVIKLNRGRYLHYNPEGNTGKPWALISRIRLEQDLLSPGIHEALVTFRGSLENSMQQCIRMAIERGELRADAPVKQLALLFVAIVNSSDATTRDSMGFQKLRQLYMSFLEVTLAAYGAGDKKAAED